MRVTERQCYLTWLDQVFKDSHVAHQSSQKEGGASSYIKIFLFNIKFCINILYINKILSDVINILNFILIMKRENNFKYYSLLS